MEDKEFMLDGSKMEIGFTTEKAIREIITSVSPKVLLSFREEFRRFVVIFVKKLLDKSPVVYRLCRSMECLDPTVFYNSNPRAVTLFTNLLKALSDANQVDDSSCDSLVSQFRAVRDEIGDLTFNRVNDRVDKYWYSLLSTKAEYSKLWEIVQKVLLLSHGQATVERGFSSNKEIVACNMGEKTLISKRIICDHVLNVGGIANVKITSSLLNSISSAHKKYNQYLDNEKSKHESESRGTKRKIVESDLENLREKKNFENVC